MGVKKKYLLNRLKFLWLVSSMVSIIPSVIIHVILQLSPKNSYSNQWHPILTISLSLVLIISYLITFNLIFLKSIIVIVICLLISNLNNLTPFSSKQKKLLAFLLFGSIILEAFWNGFVGRFDGLIKGFDFVVFFYVLLVLNNNEIKFWQKLLFLPILLLTGRFGFIIVTIFILVQYAKSLFKFLPLISVIVFFSFSYLQPKLYENYWTLIGSYEYLLDNNSEVFDTFEGREDYTDGYFGSPMVLLSEYQFTIDNLSIWPSYKYQFFDSGPSYIFNNMGVIVGIMYYCLFILLIRKIDRRKSVLALFILIDLKFHVTFVPWTILFLKLLNERKEDHLPSRG
tara:strand:+ start:1459 stop:2481 length:1023 start_codon:yes stop_codon:yes gene_type:complete